MKILYIVALVSFVALTWAAFAMTRYIRKGASAAKSEASELEMHQAIEARLSSIAKHPDQKHEEPQLSNEQSFAYFNKDSSDKIYTAKSTLPKDHTHPAADHR
jgi:hypothetical protein